MSETKSILREQIAKEFLQGRPNDAVADDTNLLDAEIIDSLGIFLLLGFIQENLDVTIDPEDVTLENFQSIDAIAQLIDGKKAS
ncbi:MAG: acyl carrier protein [Acidimicrobiia bacterium]